METEKGETKEIKRLEEIRKDFEEIAKRHKRRVESFIKTELQNGESPKREIYNNTNRYLKNMEYGNEKADFRGVISVNENLEVEIDEYLLSSVIFKEYNSRYYYNPEELKNALSAKIVTNETNILYGGEIIAKCEKKKREKKNTKEEAIKALEDFNEADIKRLKQILEENLTLDNEKSSTDKKIKTFLTYRPYKKIVEELTFYGVELENLLDEIKEHKNTTLKEVYEKYATAKYVYLNRRYIKSMKKNIKTISKEDYIKNLEMDYKNGNINRAEYNEKINLIMDGSFIPVQEVSDKIGDIEITDSNIILKYLYILNKNGNLKQTTLNSKVINAITQEINAFADTLYSPNKVMDLIKKHFWVREDKGVLKINGIRLEFRK